MAKIDSRLIQSVILLDRQYALTDNLILSQNRVLKDFENAVELNEDLFRHVLNVYNYVFALIDNLDRYHKIAHSIPKLNRRSAEYRALDKSMGNLKNARNQIQHINNDIENENNGPLLGSIFWISGRRWFTAILHDVGRQRSVPGPIFDTLTGNDLNQFCYVYGDNYHDLEVAISGINLFHSYIKTKINLKIGDQEYSSKDHFFAVCMEFSSNKAT